MALDKECTLNEWPLKAYKNPDFLKSDPARNVRILCEMTEPRVRFHEQKITDTIVLFGSARLRSEADAKTALQKLEASLENPNRPNGAEKAALDRARRRVKAAPYYEAAVELAEKLTRWSMERESHGKAPFTICSGGGPGIMEAANRGAQQAGGKSVGLGISLPHEQGVNDFVTDELKFEFHYFFVRKFWFVSMAKAMVAFPGGFGTMDEVFESLTLMQTGKVDDLPTIVLFGSEFWNNICNFDALVEWGTISPADLRLFRIIDDVDEAFDHITKTLERQVFPS